LSALISLGAINSVLPARELNHRPPPPPPLLLLLLLGWPVP